MHQARAIAVTAVVGVNIHMAQKRRRALVERVLRNGIRQVGVICTARYAKTDQLIIGKDAPEVTVLLVLVLNIVRPRVIDLVARLLVQIDHIVDVVGTQSPYFNFSHCPVLSLAFRTTRAYAAVQITCCATSETASIPPLTATTPQGNTCNDNRQQHQALKIDTANSEARRNNKTVVEHVEQADKHQKRDEDPEHATP